MIDATHDPKARSWVDSANGHPDFPLQNLPLGVFSRAGEGRRIGVAIGDQIVDLTTVPGLPEELKRPSLNAFMALAETERRGARTALFGGLVEGGSVRLPASSLCSMADCTMHLPAAIGDYTDFYAGIHHATNVGRLFRPDNPLLSNYKYVPIGYHGRASSVCVSGAPVIRPVGQRKSPDGEFPVFGPSQRLDYELELGVWIGPGNQLGERIPVTSAEANIVGLCLLNDWSARDIQAWEYQPLGPFLAKSFVTSVSPWVVTSEALAPFRLAQPPRPAGDPEPLPYLVPGGDAYAIAVEVFLETPSGLRHPLGRTEAKHLYWTPAQLVAHHTVNGCNLQPGDLLGTGTISTPDDTGLGSLLEITRGGKTPVQLASGETRTFLQDGDTVVFRGRCEAQGRVAIGFGECRGTVVAAR